MISCQCKEWATDDSATDLLGNGHHHKCAHFIPTIGAIELLGKLVEGIKWWASQEDGVPEELWDAYAKAVFVTTGTFPSIVEHS